MDESNKYNEVWRLKRIVIAPDSFKQSLDAVTAAEAIALGFYRVYPELEIIKVPMADGGEGLVRSLVSATDGSLLTSRVTGPIGDPVAAAWGKLGDGKTCVIEMAAASGLPLVPSEKRNPFYTTTYGTGELIREALTAGCTRLIIGIGGSATNDGGAGMAQALGARLLDAAGKDIGFGGGQLDKLDRIDCSALDERLAATEIIVAADVDNPLCGPTGASYVYGPQKGATLAMLPLLDSFLFRYAQIIKRDLGSDVLTLPGGGAAGGLGAGLVAFTGAKLRPGVEIVMEAVGMDKILKDGVDLLITAEGELNRQSIHGKVPVGVAKAAKQYGIPVIALAGSLGEGVEDVLRQGIDAYFSLVPRPMTLDESIRLTQPLLANLAEQCARLIKAVL